MKALWVMLIIGCLSTLEPAFGQTSVRLRGTVAAVDGDTFSVRSKDGKSTNVRLTEKSEIVVTQPIKITEIQPGDFLGVTSVKGKDGTLTAFEIRRFPKPVNPGHRPFDGSDDQTMTNATVSALIESTAGRELSLVYQGGSQKIIVPENASISMLVNGDRSHIRPGAAVSLTAVPNDQGGLSALRMQLSL